MKLSFDSDCAGIAARKESPYNGRVSLIFRSPDEAVVITSKLTSKAQTTIPQPVRAALRLEEGDELLYEIVDQRVIVTKVPRDGAADDPFGTFDEWHSEADRKAYGSL